MVRAGFAPALNPECVIRGWITLHYITLHYITLHYITLHYITFHYITLHYINTCVYDIICYQIFLRLNLQRNFENSASASDYE